MSWRDKIKTGYFYKIGSDKLIACTGYQGAIDYGKSLEDFGFTDEMILDSIEVLMMMDYITIQNLFH